MMLELLSAPRNSSTLLLCSPIILRALCRTLQLRGFFNWEIKIWILNPDFGFPNKTQKRI